MISNVRQGFQLAVFGAQAMGSMISQTDALLIESLLLGIEVGTTIRAGVAAGGGFSGGIAALGIGGIAQLGAIISMGILVTQLQDHQQKSAQQTQGFVSGFRMVGFRGSG